MRPQDVGRRSIRTRRQPSPRAQSRPSEPRRLSPLLTDLPRVVPQGVPPDAAKLERGHWLYRHVFPSRRGPVTRWYPASRFTAIELETMQPLRDVWNAAHGS